MRYCGCNIVLHSVVAVSDEDEVPFISDSSDWASLFRPEEPAIVDPNQAPTEAAPSTPALEEGETPSLPVTPHLEPDQGALPPGNEAVGIATRIEGKDVVTQTPPLLSRLIQGYLDHTGIEACPYHQMDHGVRDPHCDHCKRALGPLYHHKIVGNRHLPVFTFDFSGPHPRKVNMAQYLLVAVWSLGHMRLLWAFGVESRQASVVLPCLQSCFEDLRALTGGSRPPILRLHSDKASEFLSPSIRTYLSQQGVRQTVNSGYDPQANGLAERWIGIVKVRATALLADVRLPPEYWSYACRWVAYVHTHRVTEIPINKTLPHFGDVVVMHQAFKKPPSFENRGSTGVCLGHDTRISGGVLVVSVINGELKEVCTAKVRKLGERVGQAWRLHVHPQDATRAAYVNRKGEVKWNLQDLDVPTVEQCVKEDALEVQDIRELGLGWAWFVNDLRTFLPAWQDMELATPSDEEPVTQIAHDVPVEPLPVQADATNVDLELHTYERPLAVTPFGAQEHVPDWQDSHAMSAYVPPSKLGRWVRTDLGVRTFQGLGKNAPLRTQVVRRLTQDAHTNQILESLPCDPHLQVSLHRRCLPGCSPQSCATRDIKTTFVYRLQPPLQIPHSSSRELTPAPFPSGGGGSLSLSPNLSSPSLSLLLRGPTFSQFTADGASTDSTFGTQTLLAMRKFLDEMESHHQQGLPPSQITVEDTKEELPECKGEVSAEPLVCLQGENSAQGGVSRAKAMKLAISAFRTLLHGCEEQWRYATQQDSESGESEAEEVLCQRSSHVMMAKLVSEDDLKDGSPDPEPQRYLCDDWIQPIKVAKKPRTLTARETMKANAAKNCLILTLMSLELGYGTIIERYQQARDAVVERYQHDRPENSPYLASEVLTDEEMLARVDDTPIVAATTLAPASMPPPTCLIKGKRKEALDQVHAVAVKDNSLKMYHVMSVKQSLREDLAECAYQFSCRAADWTRSDMHAVPMQFEPLELHVVDALGQQEVPDYFQQPAKAITEEVSVMKGPDAQEWIAAVLEEIESFKRLGVYEEVPKGEATSTPLPARLILVTKPNIHGGPARKKARIVICGNFQDVHPDEFTASKTPSYPALRMALSIASHMGWPVECWDVSTAFLYARLFGDRDTDLGGNEIFMRPPKILIDTEVVKDGVVWKIKKALYGLRTSPIAWETERDNTLKSLQWVHDSVSYRLLPCQGSPCLWTVVPIREGEDPCIKSSGEDLTRGVVITYVDDLLLTGFQCHIDALTKALLAKYVMKRSGILPVGTPGMEKLDGIDFLGARITRDADGTIWCDQSKYILHCIRENGFINQDGDVILTRATSPPTVDEKLGEEEGTVREKNSALTQCRKYIGQMMWLTTRTRPDIAACLGILASLMVRRPKEVKSHLVGLWKYLWTTKDHAMCTLPSPNAARKLVGDTRHDDMPPSARDGPLSSSSPLVVQAYCDASFAPGGGRSRTGILVLLVDQSTNRASALLWQSRRQTLTAVSAPEAEVVALSEALMPAIIVHESCRDVGLEVGPSPEIRFIVKTDSQVALTQLRNESVTTRSRPFANKFSYARDMCYGTSMHPASVKAVFEPGKSQKADGLTKVLSGALMKSFVSDLGLAPLIH